MKDIGILFIFLIVALAFSCKHEIPVAPADTNKCDTAMVTYSISIKSVISANCQHCHGSTVYTTKGSGYNFDDYNVLKNEVDNGNLTKAINHLPGVVPMPLDKTEKISECEIRKFMIWIDAGAPNN